MPGVDRGGGRQPRTEDKMSEGHFRRNRVDYGFLLWWLFLLGWDIVIWTGNFFSFFNTGLAVFMFGYTVREILGGFS
jgi:hypothetical protein